MTEREKFINSIFAEESSSLKEWIEQVKVDLDKLIEGEVIRLSEPKELQNLWNGKQRVIIEQNKRANYYQSELQKLREEFNACDEERVYLKAQVQKLEDKFL